MHFKLFVVFVLNVGVLQAHSVLRKPMSIKNNTDLELVGTVGGKSFWTDIDRGAMSWASSLDLCQAYGMSMATIESAEEDQVVIRYLSGIHQQYFWLGGTDLNTEGDYRWMKNGQRFNYTNWKWSDGSYSGPELNCLHVNGVPMGTLEGWVAVSCSLESGTRPLCEKLN